jgi:Na+/proline symporter
MEAMNIILTVFIIYLAILVGGFITTVAWVLWLKPHFYDLLEVIPGFIVGLILTVTISNVKGRTAAKD